MKHRRVYKITIHAEEGEFGPDGYLPVDLGCHIGFMLEEATAKSEAFRKEYLDRAMNEIWIKLGVIKRGQKK